MALQDFTLLAKLEDFDLYTHNVCQKFQKSERHVLSASIRGPDPPMFHTSFRLSVSAYTLCVSAFSGIRDVYPFF